MGIFTESSGLHAIYEVEIQMKHQLMGGIPTDPKVIESWIATKTGGLLDRDEELRLMMIRTLQEEGVEVGLDDDLEKITAAAAKVAANKSTVGFKKHKRTGQLYIEARQIQAMLRENINILYSDQRWGPTGKSPKSMFVENCTFPSEYIPLWHVEGDEDYEVDELWRELNPSLQPLLIQDGVQLMIGHIEDAKGKRSTLTYHQYVDRARLKFQIMIIRDRFGPEIWKEVWTAAEGNGLGAVRSQLYGTFDLVRFDRIREAAPRTKNSMIYVTKAEQKKLAEAAEKESAEKQAAVATAEDLVSAVDDERTLATNGAVRG